MKWSTTQFHDFMRETYSKPNFDARYLHEDESTEADSWIQSEVKSWEFEKLQLK